jgi:hypothetical protein
MFLLHQKPVVLLCGILIAHQLVHWQTPHVIGFTNIGGIMRIQTFRFKVTLNAEHWSRDYVIETDAGYECAGHDAVMVTVRRGAITRRNHTDVYPAVKEV